MYVPPKGFPYCLCRGLRSASVNATVSAPAHIGGGLTEVCFEVLLAGPTGTCGTTLSKFEIAANGTRCRGAHVRSTSMSASSAAVHAPHLTAAPPILKVPLAIERAPGAVSTPVRVCITLRPPCDTLESLCLGEDSRCWYVVFVGRACCFTGNVPASFG